MMQEQCSLSFLVTMVHNNFKAAEKNSAAVYLLTVQVVVPDMGEQLSRMAPLLA